MTWLEHFSARTESGDGEDRKIDGVGGRHALCCRGWISALQQTVEAEMELGGMLVKPLVEEKHRVSGMLIRVRKSHHVIMFYWPSN